MKLSFAISLQETNFNYIVKNNKWQEKLKLLADLGYHGVELGIKNPEGINADVLKNILDDYSLELSAIGTGQVYIDEGLSISSLKKKIRIRSIEKIKRHIDLASLFNTQVIIGLVRGKIDEYKNSVEQCAKNLFNSTIDICDYAASKDVILAIEPLNRYETSFLNNVEEAISFIKKIKSKNLKILLDTFHMNIEEKNLVEPIQKGIKYLSHFHLADNNRKCPGDGYIDFNPVIDCLKRSGYKGYLSGEMLPVPTAEYCIRKFFKVISSYIGGH